MPVGLISGTRSSCISNVSEVSVELCSVTTGIRLQTCIALFRRVHCIQGPFEF